MDIDLYTSYYFAAIILGIAGVIDIVYREIDPEFWYPFLLIGYSLGVGEGLHAYGFKLFKIYFGVSVFFALIILFLYLLGYIGGADVFASFLIAFSMPAPPKLTVPPILDVFLYSAVYSLVYRTIMIARTVGISSIFKVHILVPTRDLLTNPKFKWWIPRGIGIEGEIWVSLAEENGLSEKYVEASPGSPLIAMYFLGVLSYLVFGSIIAELFNIIT